MKALVSIALAVVVALSGAAVYGAGGQAQGDYEVVPFNCLPHADEE